MRWRNVLTGMNICIAFHSCWRVGPIYIWSSLLSMELSNGPCNRVLSLLVYLSLNHNLQLYYLYSIFYDLFLNLTTFDFIFYLIFVLFNSFRHCFRIFVKRIQSHCFWSTNENGHVYWNWQSLGTNRNVPPDGVVWELCNAIWRHFSICRSWKPANAHSNIRLAFSSFSFINNAKNKNEQKRRKNWRFRRWRMINWVALMLWISLRRWLLA